MTTAVECKLIREGGTRAEAHGTEYHFQPYTDGAHVAVIENDEHADVFLGIREGYRLYRGEGKPVGAIKPVAAAVAKAVETKEYADGAKATGTAPLPDASPVEPAAAPEILLGGDYRATFDIGGITYQLGAIVAQAHAASGLDAAAWNALGQSERDTRIEAVLNSLAAAAGAPKEDPAPPTADERAVLAAEYERLYGKKPHHNTGIEKLREAIAAKQ